jgi:hypothetical protein
MVPTPGDFRGRNYPKIAGLLRELVDMRVPPATTNSGDPAISFNIKSRE